jgi:hypothetical protein
MVIVFARSSAGYSLSVQPSPLPRRVGVQRCHFRGLLRLHSRYGPRNCLPTMRGLCREAPPRPVTRSERSPAIEPDHQLFEWVLPPLVISPVRAHAKAPGACACPVLHQSNLPRKRSISLRFLFDGFPPGHASKAFAAFRSSASFNRNSRLASVSRYIVCATAAGPRISLTARTST